MRKQRQGQQREDTEYHSRRPKMDKPTACYWKNNQERGYKTAPESMKVDGTNVTWENAVDAMNRALQNAGSKWRYELKGALPTLRKQ